jgi:ATP-dependent Clp protease ATP-binding subunit ClpB
LEGFERERFFEDEIMPIIRDFFRPEFINRFDEMVVFNPLSVDDLVMISRLQIEKIEERLKDKNITIKVSEQKLHDFAKKSYNPAFGARPLIRLLQDQIENVIARKFITGEIEEGDVVNF